MAQFGYRQNINFDGVNPHLAEILRVSAASYDDPNISRVELISGKREGDPRQHGHGNAIDIQLYDKSGKPIPDYQDSKHFGVYQNFANHVRSVQTQLYPDLNNDLRWGGYFSGPIGKGGKYGAMDLMHFDLAGSKLGMAAGNWANGLSDQWKKIWGIGSNAGTGVSGGGIADASGMASYGGNSVLGQASAILDQQGYSPAAKAAILASMSRESGFDPSATNNNGERSYGLFQWNGDRQDAMRAFTQNYAKENGVDPNSVQAQLAFFQNELNGPEKTAGDALRNATDVASANAAMRQYERYGGGDAEEAARLATAQNFLNGNFSNVRASRGAVTGTPTADRIDPSVMQMALNDAGVKDDYGSPLKVDGVLGPRTMSARDRILDTAKSLNPQSSPQQISAVQAALNSLGVRGQDGNPLQVDGQFGPQTAYAVTQIQPKFSAPVSPRAFDTGDPATRGTITWVAKDKNEPNLLNGVRDAFGNIRDDIKQAGQGIHDALAYPGTDKSRLFYDPQGHSRILDGLQSIFGSSGTPSLPDTAPVPVGRSQDATPSPQTAPAASQAPVAGNMPSTTAMASMNLTPQEQNLYQRHLDVLNAGQGVQNPDGSTSTLYQTSADIDGKTYNFPTVWDGKILPPDQAIKRAIDEKGLNYWPSYSSPDAAEQRYNQMHQGLALDITPSTAPIPSPRPNVPVQPSRLADTLAGTGPFARQNVNDHQQQQPMFANTNKPSLFNLFSALFG
jgi:hypothetical protein